MTAIQARPFWSREVAIKRAVPCDLEPGLVEVSRAFMVEPMNRARVEVQATRRDSDRRSVQLVAYTIDLMQRATDITTDRLTLGVVLGPLAPLTKRLGDVAETFRETNASVTAWSEGSLADEAVEPQLAEILDRRGDAVAALLISAYETVGWEQPNHLVRAVLPPNT